MSKSEVEYTGLKTLLKMQEQTLILAKEAKRLVKIAEAKQTDESLKAVQEAVKKAEEAYREYIEFKESLPKSE